MFNASLIILVHHVIKLGKRHLLLSTKVPINVFIGDVSFTTIITKTLLGILIDSELSHDTAQKFSIKDSSVNVTKSCGFGHISPNGKLHLLGSVTNIFLPSVVKLVRNHMA